MTNLISLSDAAKRLSISWERAWRALLKGDLDGMKLNGRWYVTHKSIRRYERVISNAADGFSAFTSGSGS